MSERRYLTGVSYEAAVHMQDAFESGLTYNFRDGSGERFTARIVNVERIDPKTLAIDLEKAESVTE